MPLKRAKSKHCNSFLYTLYPIWDTFSDWQWISKSVKPQRALIKGACKQQTWLLPFVWLKGGKERKKREGSQVSTWIHENTCFSSPSVIHRGLTPHLVPISIALVALPRVKAQTRSCTKDRDLWLCDCQPLGSKPELTCGTGPYAVGISEGRYSSFFLSTAVFPRVRRNGFTLKSARKWLIVVYFALLCEARKLFQVKSNVQNQTSKN